MKSRLRILFPLLLLNWSLLAGAAELTKMTIATGVDPGFAIFYVAKMTGILERNGLDVDLRTGPSGGAMIPLLVSNDSNASMSASLAGINNHVRDQNIVAVAQMLRYDRWFGIVTKNDVKSLAELKNKKVAVSIGTASENFWYDALKSTNLNPDDFKSAMVNVEAPEMVAAIERGNVQAFSAWEPWLSRTVINVPGTKILMDNLGSMQDVAFIYMNRKWIEANRNTAMKFMKAMKESNDFINKEPEKTKEIIGKFLNLPKPMLDSMMPKVSYTLELGPDAYNMTKRLVDLQVTQGRIKPGQFKYQNWFYPDLLRSVSAEAVTLPVNMP